MKSCEKQGFSLSVQIIKQNHTSTSIISPVIHGNTLFQIKHSLHLTFLQITHWVSALLGTSCSFMNWAVLYMTRLILPVRLSSNFSGWAQSRHLQKILTLHVTGSTRYQMCINWSGCLAYQ